MQWNKQKIEPLLFKSEHVVLEVPRDLEERLNKPIFIYQVPAKSFELLNIPPYNHNYRSLEPVKCIAKQRFETVIEAITYFGGTVKIKYTNRQDDP